MIQLMTWNVNGIRAAIRKGFWESIEQMSPDIICLQETKADQTIMESGIADRDGYDLKFMSATSRKGYSGTAIYTEVAGDDDDLFIGGSDTELKLVDSSTGLGIEEFDVEGRVTTNQYEYKGNKETLKFTVINAYYPQGGRGPERVEYKIRFYKQMKELVSQLRDQGELVMLTGDFNTTVADIDLARPKENRKNTGCLPEEREAMDWFLTDGFVDAYRALYPNQTDVYSYWDQITRARERNVGWRIDYWIIDERLMKYVKDVKVRMDVQGSDHCPVILELDI